VNSVKRTFTSGDGTSWDVAVQLPGASNAMVVFRYPGSSHLDRYAWFLSHGPEARNVTARLPASTVMDALDDPTLRRLFRRSMPIRPAGWGPRTPPGA
jgi:hypothetical protein